MHVSIIFTATIHERQADASVSRPLANDLADAGVGALIRVFPLAKVDEVYCVTHVLQHVAV